MSSRGLIQDPTGTNWLVFRNAVLESDTVVADGEVLEMPREALELFRQLEQRVSQQEFSFIDEIIARIEAYDLRVCWEGSPDQVPVRDVQLMSGGLSFRLKAT